MKKTIFIIFLLSSSILLNAQNIYYLGNLAFDQSKVLLSLSPENGVYLNNTTLASDGDLVYKWVDQGNNAFEFKNSNSSKRPRLVVENGKSFIQFSSGEFLENIGIKNKMNGLEEFSLFIEVHSDIVNTDKGFLDTESPDGKDDLIALRYDKHGANTGRTKCLKVGLNSNSSSHQVETQSYTQSTDRQMIAITWKRHERLVVYVNGAASDSSNNVYSGTISHIKKLILGKGPKDQSSNSGWEGKIGSVFYYKEKLPKEIIESVSITLPIELATFTGDFENNSVVLDWSTYSEINNSHFDIEHSVNGIDYKRIGGLEGAGNSSQVLDYKFVDTEPIEGYNYYRLKQHDFDGRSETFDPISVYVPKITKGDIIDFEIFPNPISKGEPLRINIRNLGENTSANISLSNISGKVLFSDILKGDISNYSNQIENLEVGQYVLRIVTDNNKYTIIIIVR